jgi:DNA-binding PadR family transcriptional regulator
MSSSTRLLVLGVVRIFQPVHGYEVRRELITWRAQEWASVQPGSIYNALKTLTRDGFLEVVGTDQVGGRPERTSYRLTTAGEEEFRILLREEWWTVRPPTDPLIGAISFIGFVSRAEAIAALEHRTAQIHSMVRGIQFAINEHDGIDSPFHVREMMRLMNARVLAEVEWAQQFIARLKAGEYATADDPPWQPRSQSSAPASRRGSRGNRGKRPRGNGARPAPVERPAKRDRSSRGEPVVRPDARRDRNVRGEPVERPETGRGRNGRGDAVKRGRQAGRGQRARAWRGRSDRR